MGKTCLVDRYLHGRFDGTSRPTVGAAFGAKTVHRNSTVITVGIWDTAGQERFESISKLYYRGAKAALVCFDLTNKASFSKVKFWVEELKAYAPECLIFLVGTKVDLVLAGVEREVNEAELNKVNAPASPLPPHALSPPRRLHRRRRGLFTPLRCTGLGSPPQSLSTASQSSGAPGYTAGSRGMQSPASSTPSPSSSSSMQSGSPSPSVSSKWSTMSP